MPNKQQLRIKIEFSASNDKLRVVVGGRGGEGRWL